MTPKAPFLLPVFRALSFVVLLCTGIAAQPLLSRVDESSLTAAQTCLLNTMRTNVANGEKYHVYWQPKSYVVEFDPGGLLNATRILFNFSLFPAEQDLLFARTQLDERSPVDFSWTGKGFDAGPIATQDAILTVQGQKVSGSLWSGSEFIWIWPLGGGRHALFFQHTPSQSGSSIAPSRAERSPDAPVICAAAEDPVATPRAVGTAQRLAAGSPRNDCSELTLLGVYTAAAAKEAPANLGMDVAQLLQHGVDIANLAYANSGIYTRLKLAALYQTTYVEGGCSDASDVLAYLDWAKNNSDVKSERRNSLADIVALVTKSGCPFSGIGYSVGPEYDHLWMAATSWGTTLAHEIGHLQGLRDNSGVCSSANGWRTMMSGLCGDLTIFNTNVIPYFTNPVLTRDGVVLSNNFEVKTVNQWACRLSSYEGPAAAITALVGDKDNFSGDDVPTRSTRADTLTRLSTMSGQAPGVYLDQEADHLPVGITAFYSFPQSSGSPTSAKLRLHLKSTGRAPYDDVILIEGVTSSPSEVGPACKTFPPACVSVPLRPVVALRDLLGREPLLGETYEVVLDLARAPVRTGSKGTDGHWSGPPDEYRDLLYEVFLAQSQSSLNFNLVGGVGVVITDDTGIDWAELTVTEARTDYPAGDMNADGSVDQADVQIILDARGTRAWGPAPSPLDPTPSHLDPRDLDRDGQITVMDARLAALKCSLPGCAPKP